MQNPTAEPDHKLDRREAFREAAETLNATFKSTNDPRTRSPS